MRVSGSFSRISSFCSAGTGVTQPIHSRSSWVRPYSGVMSRICQQLPMLRCLRFLRFAKDEMSLQLVLSISRYSSFSSEPIGVAFDHGAQATMQTSRSGML